MSIEKKYDEYWKDIANGYFDSKTSSNEIIMAYLATDSGDLLNELYCRSIVNWSNSIEEWLDKIKPSECSGCTYNCNECGLKDMYVRDTKSNSLIHKSLFLKNK